MFEFKNYNHQKVELFITNDGSTSLFVPAINETYHSHKGAIKESKFVYLQEGLCKVVKNEETNIFEFGFGTGLNALLVLDYCMLNQNQKINYTTVEKFPISIEIANELNYHKFLNNNDLEDIFQQLHTFTWNEKHNLIQNFCFKKWQLEFLETPVDANSQDIIFYDAFAPSKQKEVWTVPYLKKCFQMLKTNAFLVTYCANGQFKRTLLDIGFEVETLPGPMGKKEIIRAWKIGTRTFDQNILQQK